MDCIRLTDIRAYGYTGFLPEEQVLGQWFEVNVTLWLDLTAVGINDQIENTIDYRATIAAVQNIIKTNRFALLEKLAAEIAQILLQNPLAQQVNVQLTKPAAPIPDFSGKITIELTRTKALLPV